jgi:glycosyltransferase involved in cell wall biosynthesis
MKVLHIHAGNLYGGVETLLVTLARSRALCPEMKPEFALCFEGRLAQELRREEVPVHILGEVRLRRPGTVWKAQRHLERVLQERKPEAIVCHMPWTVALFGGVIRRAAFPLIFWMHNPFKGWGWAELWTKGRRPSKVICNSSFTARDWKGERRVIYCPLADQELPKEKRNEIRQREGIKDHEVVLVQASRLQPWKGHRVILEALAGLSLEDEWKFWIIGGAQRPEEKVYAEELRQRVSEEDCSSRVKFFGERADVRAFFEAADIYVQVNEEPEPWGLSVMEAMLAGLPVITAREGGVVELVGPAQQEMVTPGAKEEMSRALRELIRDRDRRERLGRKGRQQALVLGDPAARLKEIYEYLRS